jgi:hypothetical protein
VLAAEIIGFVTAFDMASALRDVLEEIYQQSIPLYGLTDLYSFFSTVTQYNALREKRLSIDVCYGLLRMRPLLNSWAECSVVISCGKVDYDKSG